ncbi:DUF975 family protein [Pseudomonas sp. LA21]|uniref:DUF975 family protein n=1 Tax=unclassified Pseudomonas TaxID=196821 RepID=UPI001FB5B79B|nr:DUF975 family protein [Pseudomonas sp. LA21]MCJ1885759.1 DUF975 family protein [Pseudomonas sp. LA21]
MQEISAQNPYSPPQSDLQSSPSALAVPSVEEALARGYDFSIGEVISEAWKRVKGMKGLLIAATLVYIVAIQTISFAFGLALGLGFGVTESQTPMGQVAQVIASILAGAVCYPLAAGVAMLGIRRAADQKVSFDEMFSHFALFVPLLVTGLLMTLLMYVGLLLLIIPGLYLSLAYQLAIPLAVERKLSPWQALEASRKAITRHWFKILGLYLTLCLITFLSMLPLGIGLVWTIPLLIISGGVLYRRIFGVLPPAN